jgi:hypothetical protein
MYALRQSSNTEFDFMNIHMHCVSVSNALYYFPALCKSVPDAEDYKDTVF